LPNDAALLNEEATLYGEQRDFATAIALLDRSLALDDRYGETYSMRADIHFEAGEFAAALADYENVLAIDAHSPAALSAWSGKALTLARLDRPDDAIEANRQALAIRPGDVIAHRNLAILYRQTGHLDAALVEAEAARSRAAPREAAELDRFIESLRTETQAGPPR
jgi:tetratricopeptide (TPR) repeat protein